MKRRAEGAGGATPAPINRSSTTWACSAPERGTCTPSDGGAFPSRAECEAHPLCSPPNPAGVADGQARHRHALVAAARDVLLPIESAIRGGDFRLGLASGDGLLAAEAAAFRVDRTAWFFARQSDPPIPPEYVGHHLFFTAAVDGCTAAPSLLLLHAPDLDARFRRMGQPWPVTRQEEALLTRAGLAVAFTHTVAIPPGRSLAHITVPMATMRCTVWGMPDSRALLVLG